VSIGWALALNETNLLIHKYINCHHNQWIDDNITHIHIDMFLDSFIFARQIYVNIEISVADFINGNARTKSEAIWERP
jgi:hypothetical protein